MTPKITCIVLTGGPCAGKTTALSTLTRELAHDGKIVVIVPEVPTILFANRFSARTALTDVERVEYVRQMCLVQVTLEDAMRSSLEMECERNKRPGVLDEKTLVAWAGHPYIRVVDNSTDFKGKIDRVVATIRQELGAQDHADPPTPLSVTGTCGFDEAWVGPCKNALPCKTHDEQVCKCGRKATQNCSATLGPLVCGMPLCGRCRCH